MRYSSSVVDVFAQLHASLDVLTQLEWPDARAAARFYLRFAQVLTHTYTYIYIYIYTHTYTHTPLPL